MLASFLFRTRARRVLLALALLVEVGLPLALVLASDAMLFHPAALPRPEERLAAFRGVPARVVHVARPDGRLLAAYDATPTTAEPDAPVVLFCHGNAGNLAMRAGFAAWFAAGTRCRLLMPDYSGYGGNPGTPSEADLAVDALAAFDHLVAAGVPPGHIVVYGESIGGVPATVVAAQRRVGGLVMQSTFSSLASMAWSKFPWLPLAPLLVRGRMRNVDRVAGIEAPILLVHGTADELVPFAEAEALRAAARPGTELLAIPRAGHNDLCDVAGDAYPRGLGERFRRWIAR